MKHARLSCEPLAPMAGKRKDGEKKESIPPLYTKKIISKLSPAATHTNFKPPQILSLSIPVVMLLTLMMQFIVEAEVDLKLIM